MTVTYSVPGIIKLIQEKVQTKEGEELITKKVDSPASQVINMSEETYQYYTSGAVPERYLRTCHKPWSILTPEERLNWHLSEIQYDLHATSFSKVVYN